MILSNVERAALAIAAAAERIDKLDVVWVAEQALAEDRLRIEQTAGRTPVKSIVDQHVDMQRLDFVRLGKVAIRVAQALAADQHQRFTKKQVKRLLLRAVEAKSLTLDDLDERVRSEISKELARSSPT